MSQKLTILFDLDGTLVNTAPDLMHAHNHVMKKYGYDERKLSDIKKLAGRGSKVMLTKSMQEMAELTGKIKKTRDIFKILPFIMEKAEIIKKTKSNISSEECKLLTIQILKKMVEMSNNSDKNENELLSFIDHNVGEFIQVLVKASKNEYEFNKRYTLFQRLFNWIMFSRLMSIFKTGAEIALL